MFLKTFPATDFWSGLSTAYPQRASCSSPATPVVNLVHATGAHFGSVQGSFGDTSFLVSEPLTSALGSGWICAAT